MRQLRALALVSALVVLCAAGSALPAGAAPSPGPGRPAPVSAAPLSTTSFSTTLTRTADGDVGAADVIYCGGYVTYAYDSGGAVRADAEASCTAPVDQIWLRVGLYNGGGVNIAERFASAVNDVAASQFAVFGCPGLTATYSSAGAATFTKAGYANSPLYLVGQTPPVSITC